MSVPEDVATRLSKIAVTHAPLLLEEPLQTTHQECFELALRELGIPGDPDGSLHEIYTSALNREIERLGGTGEG